MSGQDPEKNERGAAQEPDTAHTREDSRKSLSKRYKQKSYDVESQSPTTQGAPFPAATYGINPSDHPTEPPRRVPSMGSLRKTRSLASLRTDGNPQPADPDSMSPAAQHPEEHPEESIAEELAWNSSHPCFPHPNPHVPLNSPAYEQTRIIRIKRDWMAHGDLAPAYSNIYPEILDPLLPESEFRFLINHVNRTLLEAFDPFSKWNWVDGVLGLMTGWLWEDFRPGGMKSQLRGLEFWIEQWNQRVGERDGVRVIPLRRTGYMNLDIEIPDPQVRVVDPAEEEEERLQQQQRQQAQFRVGDEGHPQMHMRVGELRRGTATTETETDSRI